MTGLFAWLALKMTYASKGRGHALFFWYFALASLMTAFASNDVCIMTLTPIICYFSRATGVDPLPYLVAEFVASNLWGMLLIIGACIVGCIALRMHAPPWGMHACYTSWMRASDALVRACMMKTFIDLLHMAAPPCLT